MSFESCSFNIGENTLQEIENQANLITKTPLTSKNQQSKNISLLEDSIDEIVEESPNAKENVSVYSLNIRERFKNATQRAKEKRKVDKSAADNNKVYEISSISRMLQVEEMDFSAWERSAAKLISPAVQPRQKIQEVNQDKTDYDNLFLDISASQDIFQDEDLDQAIITNVSIEQELDSSMCDVDNVTFVQPTGPAMLQDFHEEELIHSKPALNSFLNESVFNVSNLMTHEVSRSKSLLVDTSKNLRLLENWNLPQSVVSEYRKKNVVEMFEWQCECLKKPEVLFQGNNLVYSAPTSAGKTFVSEVLMIKNILERKKKALFILPFVSIVREKMFHLQDLLFSSGVRVEGFFGGYHPPGGFDSIDLAVCTIEKANSIVNKLLELSNLQSLGMVVIDEVHLISDPQRGYILELLLTKILFMCEKFQLNIQIVAMSATLPNVDLLCKWLRAEFFETDYRPVELREMVKVGENIYDRDMKFLRKIDGKLQEFFPKDPDEVCQLAMETIMENCQLIVFCPSKDWCEQLCTNLARGIHQMLKTDILSDIIDKKKLENLLEKFKSLPSGVDSNLQRCLGYSAAFHHAGLTCDERDIIEMGFKDGTLKALFATSTLSSGVNLPARRVIIRTPRFGNGMMSNLTYRQMIGRAGRKGKDILGESILICDDKTDKMGRQLVATPLDPVTSCLDVDGHSHLKRALLEIIASGVVSTKNELESFVNSTLFCRQREISTNYFEVEVETKQRPTPKDINSPGTPSPDPIRATMDFLLDYEFIRLHHDDDGSLKFVPTRLGMACLSSSLPPKDGFLLFSELQKSRQNFVLESELHAIYLVTPFSVAYQLNNVDWVLFEDMLDKLPPMMQRVGEMVGVSHNYVLKMITGKEVKDYRVQQIHKRFYTALALQELVNEKSISEVSAKFKIHRGLLQNLQQSAATFAGVVTTFCKSLGSDWNLLALILTQFRERLFFGIHPDLMDLMKIPTMSSTKIARALFKSGLEKLPDLANSKALKVENVLMDLGGSFFVSGKSTEMKADDLAKLLIKDARNHLEMEMGLRRVEWEEDEEATPELEQEDSGLPGEKFQDSSRSIKENLGKFKENDETSNQKSQRLKFCLNQSEIQATPEVNTKKRKAETQKSSPPESLKKPKVDVSNYRQKLRSSGGALDLKSPEADLNASLFTAEDSSSNSSLSSSDVQELTQKFLTIIDISSSLKLFKAFEEEILKEKVVGMSFGVKKFEKSCQKIGGNLLNQTKTGVKRNFIYDETFYIDCISFCYNANRVCLLKLQDEDSSIRDCTTIKTFLATFLARDDVTVNIYESREALKALQKATGIKTHMNVKISDPRIASWLIDPDTNFTWHEMVTKFTPEHLEILEIAAKYTTRSSLGLSAISTVDPKTRSAVECFLVNSLLEKQTQVLKDTVENEKLFRVFQSLEMSIQASLLKMELVGFPVNQKKLQSSIESASLLQRQLEQRIFELNERKFNLSSSREVSKVVGIHKNLESKKKVSTAKNVLEKLDLPIANCIMTWRTLEKTVANMQPKMKMIRGERIFGNSFSLTQTGRISMYEPNLQNVTKDFEVEVKDHKGDLIKHTISFRSVFECQPDRVLLSADFCQLELRILTHLCQDENLLKIMNSPGEDIFKKIAAKWGKVEENDVTDEQRSQTKQICYGIIYGMGNKALSESLKVDEESAAKLAAEFHSTYPGIKRYTKKTVNFVQSAGYCQTLVGRRRYLPAIKSEKPSERSQAERQALNTCIQGTASDLVKNAILRMDRELRRQHLNNCNLVLHLHDELFFEVPTNKLNQAAAVLTKSMENCVKLSVPLMVKIKVGTNWGEMKKI